MSLSKDLEELRAAAGAPTSASTFESSSAAQEPNRGPDSFTQAIGARANPNDHNTAAPQRKWFIGLVALALLAVILWMRHARTAEAIAQRAEADSVLAAQKLKASTQSKATVAVTEHSLNLDGGAASLIRSIQDSLAADSTIRNSPFVPGSPEALQYGPGATIPVAPGSAPKVAPLAGRSLDLKLDAPASPVDATPLSVSPVPTTGSRSSSDAYRPIESGAAGLPPGVVLADGSIGYAPPVESPEEKRARLARERADSMRQVRDEQLAWQAKEIERLRNGATKMSGGDAGQLASRTGAGNAGGTATPNGKGESDPEGISAALQQAMSSLGGAQGVPTGATVPAILLQPFSSLTADVSVVQARLTAPLKGQAGIVLPRGSVGYAQASVRQAQDGSSARVVLTFNTWVTPDNRTITLTGIAQSLETQLVGLEGHVNRRLALRTVKAVGAAALAVGATLGQNQQASVFAQQSAAQQTRTELSNRMLNIADNQIGGDGAGMQNEVTLKPGTPFVVVFNLPSGVGK